MTNNIQQIVDVVYDFAPSPEFSKDQIIFAARGSGLYRSQDGGKTWEFALDSLGLETPLAISCVALAPNFAEMPHVFAGGPGGVLRSRDGGRTWYVTMLPSPPPFITGLAISPNYADDGIVFASTMDDGVFRSRNRGVDWTAWNFGLFDLHVLSIALSPNFAKDKNVFLGTESGIFHSVNGGLGWRELDFQVELAPVLSLAVSPSFSEEKMVFAGTEDAGLFLLKGDTGTWQPIDGIERAGPVDAILLSKDFPESPCILVTKGETILISRDGGQTWRSWQADLQLNDQLMSITALNDICPEGRLLVGLANGDILQV